MGKSKQDILIQYAQKCVLHGYRVNNIVLDMLREHLEKYPAKRISLIVKKEKNLTYASIISTYGKMKSIKTVEHFTKSEAMAFKWELRSA